MPMRSLFHLAAKLKTQASSPFHHAVSPFLAAVPSSGLVRPVADVVPVEQEAAVERFTMAAWRGDVTALRACVMAGQPLNEEGSLNITALRIAALAGKPDAVRYLIQEGADPQTASTFQDALGTAQRMLTLRKRELEDTGKSYKEWNPPHLDSKVKDFAECVDLLQNPATAFTAAPEMPSPEQDASGARWWQSV
ncbi:hypothetical protein T484DRAFT_3417496 [Baffinella frigidus]|nr:hypothetical protein T484DRAFT_3417496 [Cryptophyta sp. CCMP2293]|mmetsp:Transcript_7229/g.17393  ORF Transcript_7229/g.17393 Transcript_7229/m.17393 type:complete len:194 (+) Transcript_7229:103-684(+)